VGTIEKLPGEALWARVGAALRDEIGEHHDDGDWIAPEAVLAARFGVNRHTLRRAVDELVQEGIVERIHGRGTRVLAKSLTYDIGRNTRFTEQLAASGRVARVELLEKGEGVAEGGVARGLQVAEGTPVLRLRTLRGEHGVPFAVSWHFLCGPAADVARARYRGGSLHGLLRAEGLTLERRHSLVTTHLPLAEDARALRLPRTRPVLRVKGVNVCVECGDIQEYVISQFRGDQVELSVVEAPSVPECGVKRRQGP
jgi:GntR family phosphonate transport system transcriptional regulator